MRVRRARVSAQTTIGTAENEGAADAGLDLSLEHAAWLWDWADLGTVITIHA
jgi:hypothetical protein